MNVTADVFISILSQGPDFIYLGPSPDFIKLVLLRILSRHSGLCF